MGRALGTIEAYKVAAAGVRPGGAARVAQALGELALDGLKARTQELGMLFHVLLNRLDGGKEAHVTQLVELVGADEAGLQALGELGDNRGARTNKADAGARKVILDVEAKATTRSSVPAVRARSKMFASSSVSSYRSCTQ